MAPGAGGAVFSPVSGLVDPSSEPRMNNANGVPFRAVLSGAGVTPANDIGIWGHNDLGSLSLLAREGSPLPAAGAGVTISVIANAAPALNGANRIAFQATLAGAGFAPNVIIAANALGDLVLAARGGQVVEIAPGEFRTVSGFGFGPITGPGTQDGSSTSWNDNCRLLFRADYSGAGGGVGLFIADVNATCRPVDQLTVTSLSGGKVNLSWPGSPGVHLQSATNLIAPMAWTDVPDTAGQSSAAVLMAGPQMFFRLASP